MQYVCGWSYPSVIVYPSPDVERISQKNGVTFAELLKPFGVSGAVAQHIASPLTVRSATKPLTLRNVGVRFIAPHECTTLDGRYIDTALDVILSRNAPSRARENDGVRDAADAAHFVKANGATDNVTTAITPWYAQYTADFLDFIRFESESFIDAPFGLVCAVSANDKDEHVARLIDNIKQNKSLPNAFVKGVYDASMLIRAIVVVHDKHADANDVSARDRSAALHRRLQAQHGDAIVCRMIEINSVPFAAPNVSQRDQWSGASLRGRLIVESLKSGMTEQYAHFDDGRDGGDDTLHALDDTSTGLAAAIGDFGNDGTDVDLERQVNEAGTALNNNVRESNATVAASLDGVPVLVNNTLSPALYNQQPRGVYLANADYDSLTAFTADLLARLIVPNINQRIANLNEKVNTQRKGFKNSLKTLLIGRRSERGKAVNVATNTYELTSSESICRQLADLLFIVGDFDGALALYKLSLGDYKADKMYRYLASVYEMMGICGCALILNGQYDHIGLREIHAHFQSAQLTFASIKQSRYVTRVAVVAAELYRAIQSPAIRVDDTVELLVRAANNDTSVRSALLHEQSAYAYILSTPPAVRKFAFHLIVAGFSFFRAHDSVHGVRCYASASVVYESRELTAIDSHIQHKLGREYFHLNNPPTAVQYFCQILSRPLTINPLISKASRQQQQQYLHELVYVVKHWSGGEAKEIAGLALPIVHNDNIRITNDGVTVASQYVVGAWNATVRSHRLTVDADTNNRRLFTPSMAIYKEADRGTVIGERIVVVIQITNPLSLDLAVTNLRLRAKHVATDDTMTDGAADDVFTVSALNVTLTPAESRFVELNITPRRAGKLYIGGVEWAICDVLLGFHAFVLPQRVAPGPPPRRGPPVMQADPSLDIAVLPPLPCLQINVEAFPRTVVHGECVPFTMTLRNAGEQTMHKLLLRISHPQFITVARPHADDKSDPDCFSFDWSDALIQLGITLHRGESVTLPMFLRGSVEGQHNVGFLFRYEPLDAVQHTIKYRLAYAELPLTVRSLFAVRLFVKPSFASVSSSLLGMEITDKQQTDGAGDATAIRIIRVSVLSKSWAIATVGAVEANERDDQLSPQRLCVESAVRAAAVLAPQDNAMLYFRIRTISSANTIDPSQQQELAAMPTRISAVALTTSEYDHMIVNALKPPFSCSLGVEKAITMEEERQQLIVNPAADIADVGSPLKLDLLIEWASLSDDRRGIFHLIGSNVMKVVPTSSPVKVHLSFPPIVYHNFDSSPVCSVKVRLRIRNNSDENAVSFAVETLSADEEFHSAKKAFVTINSSQVKGRYIWRGNTKCRIAALSRHSESDVELIADFSAAGTYNLNRFRFIVDVNNKQKPRIFFFPIQHNINVIHTNKTVKHETTLQNASDDWSSLEEENTTRKL